MASKTQVVFRERAKLSIHGITFYIEQQGYPATAEKFTKKLLQFGLSLAHFPDKYPICRQNKFAKRNLHCAIFDNTYIFVYKIVKDKLFIYNIIHGKRLK